MNKINKFSLTCLQMNHNVYKIVYIYVYIPVEMNILENIWMKYK